MNPPLRLRVLTPADLSFANSLRATEGWNQTLADWQRFIALEPAGCFLAECGAVPVGTATTMVYGTALAWIGMILVHPEYRRRGIGRALLSHCLEYLQSRGVRCVKLDATPLGKKVYDSLSFKEEWTLTRWQREPGNATSIGAGASPDARAWAERDAESVDNVDTAAFGVSRRSLMSALVKGSRSALVLEAEPGRLGGFGLLRPGSQAHYLGPVVGTSATIGRRLVGALLESGREARIFWDIPDQNEAAVEQAVQAGFTMQRPLTRLYLGNNDSPGDPCLQFGIAGPEIG